MIRKSFDCNRASDFINNLMQHYEQLQIDDNLYDYYYSYISTTHKPRPFHGSTSHSRFLSLLINFLSIVIIKLGYHHAHTIKYSKHDEELFEHYKHFDALPQQQAHRMSLQVRQLSHKNLARVISHQLPQTNTHKKLKKEDFLYVCLTGIPPITNQFDSLALPGQTLRYTFSLSGQQISSEPRSSGWIEECQRLHDLIMLNSADKPIVMVYHSFGSFIAINYMKHFPINRIIGIIDIGGVPIRSYQILNGYHKKYSSKSLEEIREKIQQYTEQDNNDAKNYVPDFKMSSKDRWAFLQSLKGGFGFSQMFQDHRQIPRILKCIIFGRKDGFFQEGNLSEKALFFTEQSFKEGYQNKLQLAFIHCYGQKAKNIQSKFIFSIEEGKHSLHAQRKLTELLRKIVGDYLSFIEELHNGDSAKL